MRLALNPEQRAAVEHGDGPLLVLAGAGSGKTRVLTARVAHLVESGGIPPDRLLAVTFTNKAAGEMRERIGSLIGRDTRGLWIGTFHSMAARILRREAPRLGRGRAFTIYDEDDSLRAIKDAMEECDYDPRRWSPRSLRARISSAKNACVGPSEYAVDTYDLMGRAVGEVYPVYQRLLIRRNAYDFDDLLFEAVRLLEQHQEARGHYADRFLHVLVDEYQDTNHAQYRILKALAGQHGNICVVGDDDQSIYGWRGADLRNILDFERDFPGAHVISLEQNYRSTGAILEVANAVIANNVERKPKRLRTERPVGERIQVVRTADERREASWVVKEIEARMPRVGLRDCAVLYRTNAQSRAFEEALRRAGLPYRIVGGVPFFERREVKDLLAYLRLTVNPSDDAAFQRAVRWPRRGVGDVTLDRLQDAARETGESLLEAAARASGIEELPGAGGRALEDFAAGIARLAELQATAQPLEVLEACVRRFGLAAALEEEEDGADRLENVSELFATAAAFDRSDVEEPDDESGDASDLELYLQSVSLRSEIDDVDFDGDALTLMTLHNAKGLEFPSVFVAGLEEGLFPLSRAVESHQGLEEERRLFYVGVTRAMDRLYLTYADRRWRAGMESRSMRSSFLDELPEEPVERLVAGGFRSWRRGGERGASARAAEGFGSLRKRGQTEADGGPDPWWRVASASGRAAAGASESPSDPSATEGLRYDYSDSQVPLELAPGVRVVHPRFGEGVIVAVSGAGSAAKADIEFQDVGTKKVIVAYADLRPV